MGFSIRCRATDFFVIVDSRRELQNQASENESSFCQNFCNLDLFEWKFVIKLAKFHSVTNVVTQWFTNCHFMSHIVYMGARNQPEMHASGQPIIKILVAIVRMPLFIG